jgi:hypothetical protein
MISINLTTEEARLIYEMITLSLLDGDQSNTESEILMKLKLASYLIENGAIR